MADNINIGLLFEAAGVPKTVGEVKKINKPVADIQAENKRVAATADALAKAYNLSEKEVQQVQVALRRMEQQTGKVRNEAGGLSNIFQGIAQGIGQAATGVILNGFNLATQGVQNFLASTLEVGQAARASENAFTTFLGSAEQAQSTLAELSDFAAKTPFDLPGIRSAGQQLLAFGFQTNELIPTLERVGNVASGVNTDFNELAVIYGKARTQGRLFAEDINQLTERGIPIIGELAAQFGVTESEVRKLVESGQVGFSALEQAFINLTSEGGRFFDLMGVQSQTVIGQVSNLGDSFVQLQEQVFRVFEPAIAEGLNLFTEALGAAAEESDALNILGEGAERVRTEQVTPLTAALGLSDCFWIDNPYKDQKGSARAVRIVTRDEAIRRSIAFYQLKGGTDIEGTQTFFERTFAPSATHDGQVSY